MRYFISDIHFFDGGIIGYCGRPFSSVEQMNRTVIENFKRKARDAEVYILGDILGGNGAHVKKEVISSILDEMGIRDPKTPFHLITGNHDHFSQDEYLDMGFISVKKIDFINIGENKVMLTHDPCMVQQRGTLALCGHIHTLFDYIYNEFRNTLTINVSVERREYSPIGEDEIIQIIKKTGWRLE